MLDTIKNTIMAGAYIALGAIAYLVTPDKVVGACFFTLGIFLVTNYSSMLITRVVPMYFAKLDYKWTHIPMAIVGNFIGAFIVGALISGTRLVNTLQDPLTKIVNAKLTDNLLSSFIMAIFCGILVAYSSLTSRKYKKGSIAQLFYTAIFIVAFVVCGFDHVVANEFYFSLYSFINGFDFAMLLNLLIVLAGNLVGGFFIAIIENKNLEIIEPR